MLPMCIAFLVCFVMADLAKSTHFVQLSTRNSSERWRYGAKEHQNISSLRVDKSRWPTCTESRFKSQMNSKFCGFEVPGVHDKMITTGAMKDSCFYFSRKKTTFYEHLKLCKAFGAHTTGWCPKITLQWHNLWIIMPKGRDYWIDFTDRRRQRDFRCSNGDRVPEKFWAPSNPSHDHGEDCVMIDHNYGRRWNDYYCDTMRYYMCHYHRYKHYEEKAFVDRHPTSVELKGDMVISCKVKMMNGDANDMYLQHHSTFSSSGKYQLRKSRMEPSKRDKNSMSLWEGAFLKKIDIRAHYYTETIPACLRDMKHFYHFTDVGWHLVYYKWKCCAKYGCDSEFSVNIEAYPRTPELTVAWPSETPGELYSGDYLVANCSAYVGGFRPVFMRWEMETLTKTYTWDSGPTIANRNPEIEVKIISLPYGVDCPKSTDVKNPANGACYQITNSRTSFHDAFQLCQDRSGDDALVSWSLLSMKPDKSLFHFLAEHLTYGSKYWISLNDVDREAVFVWADGVQTSKYEWGDLWIEDLAEKKNWIKSDCAYLDLEGIHVHQPCNLVNISFICSSMERLTTSNLDFPTEAKDGPFFTSVIRIKHRESMTNSTLTCYSYTGSNRLVKSHLEKNETEAKNTTPIITFDWGAPKPVITHEKKGNKIIVTCSTHVGNGDAMTWIVKPRTQPSKMWIISTNETIYGNDPQVVVTVLSVNASGDLGNDIKSMLEFPVTSMLKGASILCYPYNYTHGRLQHIKSREKEVFGIYKLPFTEPFMSSLRSILLLLLLGLLAGAAVLTLFMPKDGPFAAVKDSSGQEGEGNGEGDGEGKVEREGHGGSKGESKGDADVEGKGETTGSGT